MPNTVDLGDLYYSLLSLCNVQQGGAIRPQQDFQKWLNTYQLELYWSLIKEFQKTQQISDKISPFIKYANILTTSVSGSPVDTITLPTDYGSFIDLEVYRQIEDDKCCCNEIRNEQGEIITALYNGTKWINPIDPDYAKMAANFRGANLQETTIQLINIANWASCLSHDIKKPTFKNPKAVQFLGGFNVAPKGTVSMVFLKYFSIPIPAVFAGSITSDVFIYNASTSTQVQWNANMKDELLQGLKLIYDRYVGATDAFQMDMAKNNK